LISIHISIFLYFFNVVITGQVGGGGGFIFMIKSRSNTQVSLDYNRTGTAAIIPTDF
jgi:hypothetical protein